MALSLLQVKINQVSEPDNKDVETANLCLHYLREASFWTLRCQAIQMKNKAHFCCNKDSIFPSSFHRLYLFLINYWYLISFFVCSKHPTISPSSQAHSYFTSFSYYSLLLLWDLFSPIKTPESEPANRWAPTL